MFDHNTPYYRDYHHINKNGTNCLSRYYFYGLYLISLLISRCSSLGFAFLTKPIIFKFTVHRSIKPLLHIVPIIFKTSLSNSNSLTTSILITSILK